MTTLQSIARTAARTAALLAALTSPLAHAHGDAQLDAALAPHGGQVRMAGPLHLELVLDKQGNEVKNRPITVYVMDHADQPIPTLGAQGNVTLLSGKNKVTASLKPDGENRLTGQASYASLPGTKAVVSVKLQGADAQQARFTPTVASTAVSAASAASVKAPQGHASHAH